jgi:molybdopterin-containing oxidoreductase family membrane subunit
MWLSAILAFLSLILLINPATRKKESILTLAALAVFISIWLEKGIGFVVGGFIPNPLEKVVEYTPTAPEIIISLGIWAFGFLMITLLFKITISVREEVT